MLHGSVIWPFLLLIPNVKLYFTVLFSRANLRTKGRTYRVKVTTFDRPLPPDSCTNTCTACRACSSRCCGLSSMVYHGWEGKCSEILATPSYSKYSLMCYLLPLCKSPCHLVRFMALLVTELLIINLTLKCPCDQKINSYFSLDFKKTRVYFNSNFPT